MSLENKTALITGAAVGIGRACAILFAEDGANLILVDMNGEKLESLKEELKKYPMRVLTYTGDVSDYARVSQIVEDGAKKLGGVDILVNNAGIWRSWHDFLEIPVEEWKKFIDVNLMGTVYFTRAALPYMLEKGWGRVINVSSVAAVYGNIRMAHYSASKGAINSLTLALAKEVTAKGVTVNSVCPGSVSPSENDDIDLMISVYGTAGRNGDVVINMEEEIKKMPCPVGLQNKKDAYGANLCTRRLGNLLPARSVLFVDPQEPVSVGDIAVYYSNEMEAKIISVRENEQGQLYGVRWNPDEKILLENDDMPRLHRVVSINL